MTSVNKIKQLLVTCELLFLIRHFYLCSWKRKTQSYNLQSNLPYPRSVGRQGINLMVCIIFADDFKVYVKYMPVSTLSLKSSYFLDLS